MVPARWSRAGLPNRKNPTTMRHFSTRNHELNSVIAPCLNYFGGGGGRKGPSKQEKQAAKQEQQAAQQGAMQQQKQMQQQMAMQQQAAEQQRQQQEAMLAQMEVNKPPPPVTVMSQSDGYDPAAPRKKGLRKSILAGESGQSSVTGYSTLG